MGERFTEFLSLKLSLPGWELGPPARILLYGVEQGYLPSLGLVQKEGVQTIPRMVLWAVPPLQADIKPKTSDCKQREI